MKISRRGLFGLGASAAVAPFVKPIEAEADDYLNDVIHSIPPDDTPKVLWPHVQYGAYVDEDGVLRVGVIRDNMKLRR